MECLAIINRLSIFSSDNEERAELCAALEHAAETLVPSDIPLSALDEALLLLNAHPNDLAMIRCICAFLASCALGDDQTVRKYLLAFTPKSQASKAATHGTAHDVPYVVKAINSAILSSVLEHKDTPIANWKSSVQPLTDLVATLSYNNGAFRAAFGVAEEGAVPTIVLIGHILTKSRKEVASQPPEPSLQAASATGESQIANVLYYTISCLAVLLTAEPSNVAIALSEGVAAEILYCYKCLNMTGGSTSLRRPGSAAATANKDRVGSEAGFGNPIRYSFASGESKGEISKWCVQALRNAAIAGSTHAAWTSTDSQSALDFGKMGEIIAVDELKWELSKLRKKASV